MKHQFEEDVVLDVGRILEEGLRIVVLGDSVENGLNIVTDAKGSHIGLQAAKQVCDSRRCDFDNSVRLNEVEEMLSVH